MAKVKIQGHASGTGVLTVTAPNTSTDRTITLPDGDVTLGAATPSIDDNGNATAITITSAEAVGIGTATPSAKFEVEDGGTAVGNVLAKITIDDQSSHYAFAVGNDTYSTTDSNGLMINQKNDGHGEILNGGSINVGFPVAGGITFGSDTAAANALDDYEEGTWTPVISTSAGSSVAGYSGNSYNYTKIGNTCTIYGYFHSIAWASITDGTYLQLQGLPFASSGYSGVSTPYSQGNLGGFYVENSGSVALFTNKDTGSEFNQGDAVPTGNRIMLSLTYRTT